MKFGMRTPSLKKSLRAPYYRTCKKSGEESFNSRVWKEWNGVA